MKPWIVKNKGLTVVLAIVVAAVLLAVFAGPGIWSAIATAHGF